MKLDMGGGDYPREGYLNVDPYTEAADIHADMGDVPLDDNTVDEIWSCHALEHVSKFRVVPILQEWKRILKPSGLITIEGAIARLDLQELALAANERLAYGYNFWHAK